MKKLIFAIIIVGVVGFLWLQFGGEGSEHNNKDGLIVVDTPRAGAKVTSPLTVRGKARGMWFFEASFPLELISEDGEVIASGIATAEGEWMTEEFVPFTALLAFDLVEAKTRGDKVTLVLRKDNPSGLSEFDDSLEIDLSLR